MTPDETIRALVTASTQAAADEEQSAVRKAARARSAESKANGT